MRFKIYSRPSDRSLQAFKDWMQGKGFRLPPNAASTVLLEPWLDDRQWVEYWQKFWTKADGASGSQKSSEE
jgi:hypothetical protein